MSTQAFGLALIAGSFAVFLVASLLFQTGEAVPAEVLTAVAALLTSMVWRVSRLWSVIVGLIVTVAAGLGMFYVAFGILQPFSPFEFVAGWLFLLGFGFALIGGIGALGKRRREAGPGKTSKRLQVGALALLGLATVLSVGGFLLDRTTVSEVEAANTSPLEMVDFEFVPTTSTVNTGQNLLLTNSDAVVHDFTLDDYDIQVSLGPGSETVIDVSALPPGTYQFYCSIHSDGVEGMVGTITVEG